jgi:UDP-glucose 4-epimerase
MRAVITGGCGFIGSYVVKQLKAEGWDLLVIDNLAAGKRENIDAAVPFVQADIRNFEEVVPHICEGDVIFHLAALTSVPASIENPLPYQETNLRGTYNILEAARIKKARGIIFSSSAAVYGNAEGQVDETMPPCPVSPYGLQKLMGEALGKMYGDLFSLPVISLRYFNVYGQGNHEEGSYAPVTARFLKAKREGNPIPIVGDGAQTRDFIHVEDVARANVLGARLLEDGRSDVFNVCSGISTSVLSIAEAIGGDKEFLPARQEVKHSGGNPKKALELLGFSPSISLEEGLGRLLN